MLKKLKIILTSIIIAAPLTLMVTPSTSLAATGSGACTSASTCACQGANTVSTGSDDSCSASKSGATIGNLANTVINIISLLVGIIAVIMILVAGIKFITSGGGEGVKSAKNTLVYALVGLVVAALAQVLIHFVLNRVASPATTKKASFNSLVDQQFGLIKNLKL